VAAGMTHPTRSRRLAVALAAGALLLTACGGVQADRAEPAGQADDESPAASEAPESESEHADDHSAPAKPVKAKPLREGEQRTTLEMAAAYTPSPPTGVGTDDYRCFLLDPELEEDAWLTGTQILPGNPKVVHHVILFRISPDGVAAAEAEDAAEEGEGWTCFGGTGVDGEFDSPDDAAWLGAWAPGGAETLVRDGYGVSLDRGTRIVMQVHYNLLAGQEPDTSATQIRWRPKTGSDLTPIHTTLLPAPVELPCRPDVVQGPLCDREASVQDAKDRFGEGPGQLANLLHLLCGTNIYPTETTSCTRTIPRSMTILGAAGHMHLLGKWIKIDVNPATPESRTILDIPLWDFDDQGAEPIDPVHLDAGDTVRVTCHHEQDLRDKLPAFDGQEEKYVVWAEGTTDEMCLGILQVVFDDEATTTG
jgi:hypothetical protein